MVSNKRVILQIAIIFGAFLLTGLLLITTYVIASNVGYVYALLIDAGSTSSKITVFKWRDWPFRSNGYVEQESSEKIVPGISSYGDNPSDAFLALQPKVQKLVEQSIPTWSVSSSPLFLAATAGMRLLTLENFIKSEAIIESLQLQLPSTGLLVKNPYSDVRIMSGRDEGIYAWITVNYVSRNFGNREQPPVDERETVGSLDLGGASTQITFVPDSKTLGPHTSTRMLYGKSFTLYSYSYLCFGKSAAETRLWAEMIIADSEKFLNPCLPEGSALEVDTEAIFGHTCVSSPYASDLVGSVLTKPSSLAKKITFNGTGNLDQCREVLKKMFPSRTCAQQPCMFGGVYRPNLRGNFVAFSGFTYVTSFLGFKDKSPSRDEFNDELDKFCSKKWEQIEQTENPGSLGFVKKFCFDGVYIEALLNNFGFNSSDSWKSIQFSEKMNNVTLSWALGYTIDASGMIESTAPKINLGLVAFVSSLAALFVISLVLVAVLVYLFRK